jgi:dCMP deaminase
VANRRQHEDLRLLALCAQKGVESPDPKTKIGCIIVRPDKSILSEACNTYPKGVVDTIPDRTESPLKYLWIEHAERNAIYLAARQGFSTEGCTMFIDLSPCVDCARAIIQAGLAEVVINNDRTTEYSSDRYAGELSMALEMLAEAGVAVRFVSPMVTKRKGEDAPAGDL